MANSAKNTTGQRFNAKTPGREVAKKSETREKLDIMPVSGVKHLVLLYVPASWRLRVAKPTPFKV
jgi:hypothetical protein